MLCVYAFLAKLIFITSRVLRIGYGYTAPGYCILKICPNFFKKYKISYPRGLVIVSGTNGKTTTSSLITHLLHFNGSRVLHNTSGSNLLRGVLTSILLDFDVFGRPRSSIAVFEVDEFSLPEVIGSLEPSVLVLLNLSRDQLDRYTEIEVIMDRWQECVAKLSSKTAIVYDQSQDYFKGILQSFKGIKVPFLGSDAVLKKTKLLGSFNAKNVAAAITAIGCLGVGVKDLDKALSVFNAAYGRGEAIEYKDAVFNIFLAKNPASFNNNLEMLLQENISHDCVLVILNDNIPDGRDVSWIYDIDPGLLFKFLDGKEVFVSGKRCLDMVVRLNYSGVEVKHYDENINNVIERILSPNNSHKNIIVLPNYSAMLEARKTLFGRSIL